MEEIIVTEEEGGADKVGINGQMNVTRERMRTRFIRTDINEGGIRRKGPSGVAYRFEVRRQSGCSAAVRKKRTSVGVSPAKSYVNVNKGGLASKGKLWAGLDQEEEHMMNWSSKDLKEQGGEKEWEYNEEEGKNKEKRVIGLNENSNIKLNHCEEEGRREGEKEGNVVDWDMKKG